MSKEVGIPSKYKTTNTYNNESVDVAVKDNLVKTRIPTVITNLEFNIEPIPRGKCRTTKI